MTLCYTHIHEVDQPLGSTMVWILQLQWDPPKNPIMDHQFIGFFANPKALTNMAIPITHPAKGTTTFAFGVWRAQLSLGFNTRWIGAFAVHFFFCMFLETVLLSFPRLQRMNPKKPRKNTFAEFDSFVFGETPNSFLYMASHILMILTGSLLWHCCVMFY